MLPYNFRNRAFEQAFDGYTGPATFVAMKTLVWAEYGIPFCAPNRLPDLAAVAGFAPDPTVATRALRFVRRDPRIACALAAVNAPDELEAAIAAGTGSFAAEDEAALARYDAFHERDGGIPFFLSGLFADNLRMNFFAVANLCRALGVPMPGVPLNEPDSRARLFELLVPIAEQLTARGMARYAALARAAC
jgi:hypothetical protein